ncbi:MAG: FAD-dependent oxidoreductase [Acidobacteria bacterium]|nr:FAD-dependent oxidoreductase [Acidobacteriota bacterium]
MVGGARSVVIVGASAAGLRCACRLKRLKPGWSVRVVDQRQVLSYAACGLPYVLSGDLPDDQDVRKTSYGVVRDVEYFARYKGVEVLGGRRAIEIRDGVLEVEDDSGTETLEWDDLVLATGARPRRLPSQPDSERVRSFHVWEDVAPLHGGLARGEISSVAVVGAGLVGCELAEAFASLWGAEVTLIEAADRPLPQVLDPEVAACVAASLESNGVRLLLGAEVGSLRTETTGVKVAVGGDEIGADVAVVAIGVEPAVELAARAGINLGPTGAIAVDDRLATSMPGVWAAGDCVECRHAVTGEPAYLPLGSLANRQGRCLANVLAGSEERFPAVAGAVAVKVFDVNVAAVGLTRSAARQVGMAARSAWITAEDTAHYWPEASDIHISLVYEVGTERVLGVQAVGAGETVKRIDVATQLISRGATLSDLGNIEHAYAPPFAPALDPLAVAAFVAANQEEGVTGSQPTSDPADHVVLDVRLAEETEHDSFPAGGVRAVPLGALRERLNELNGKRWLVVCERGPRSAEAARLLSRHGFEAEYLGGGMSWLRASRRRGSG